MNQQDKKDGTFDILIVDDDPQERLILSSYLSHEGYRTEEASDGREALDKVRILNPHVILLDVYLPGINGIEICRQIKGLEETRHIPIISITGNLDRKVRLECLEAGANDFIGKPIDMTELLIKIRNLVRLKEFENIKLKSSVMAETFSAVEKIKREWEESMDCIRDIVILVDANSLVIRCNKSLCTLADKSYDNIISSNWKDVLYESGFPRNADFSESAAIHHNSGKWFRYSIYNTNRDPGSTSLVSVITLHDITESKKITSELLHSRELLRNQNEKLDSALRDLKMTQSKMLQQEKMASIGQIAAGVAHEINNPMGFIMSNFQTMKKYSARISEYLNAQSATMKELSESCNRPDSLREIDEMRERLKIDHIISDIDDLVAESLEGADRVRMIVQDLKNFSRVDEPEHKYADINAGLESTINIIWNEIKYKTKLVKEFGDIPQIKCNPGQLNQVFLNLLVNAAQAIDKQGEIRITTWHDDNRIYVSVSDTGCGIPDDLGDKIFEPFVTTKEIGKGTGLGLSIAYDIIKKHKGEISVESTVGKGSTFTVAIPVSD